MSHQLRLVDGEANVVGRTRLDQVFESWIAFHRNNLQFWYAFERRTGEMRKVRDTYSARTIIENARWDETMRTHGEDVKINNNYTPFYARLYLAKYPEAKGFFQLKELTSKKKPAYEDNIKVFGSARTTNERNIIGRIEDLLKETEILRKFRLKTNRDNRTET